MVSGAAQVLNVSLSDRLPRRLGYGTETSTVIVPHEQLGQGYLDLVAVSRPFAVETGNATLSMPVHTVRPMPSRGLRQSGRNSWISYFDAMASRTTPAPAMSAAR